MWSVGCIFAELLLKEPLFQAKGEIELIDMIWKLLGPPNNNNWPGWMELPLSRTLAPRAPHAHHFRQRFPFMTTAGLDLLMSLLTYDPEQRITAEEALKHPFFQYVHFDDSLKVIRLMALGNPRYRSIRTSSALSLRPPLARSMSNKI